MSGGMKPKYKNQFIIEGTCLLVTQTEWGTTIHPVDMPEVTSAKISGRVLSEYEAPAYLRKLPSKGTWGSE